MSRILTIKTIEKMGNFTIDQKVKIKKEGIFDGHSGTIISLYAKVNLGALGEWSFKFTEIEGLKSEFEKAIAEVAAQQTPTPKTKPQAKQTKVKRSYNKKAKP